MFVYFFITTQSTKLPRKTYRTQPYTTELLWFKKNKEKRNKERGKKRKEEGRNEKKGGKRRGCA